MDRNISVDPDEVVQVEEIKENEPPKLGTMDGTIVGSHVWFLPPETRIIVHFNDYDQPKLSTLGKRARGLQTHMHTTGSKSYAQWKTEFVKLNQREPSGLEMWKHTHTTKNGGYIEGTCTKQFMDVANSKVEERLCNSKQPREVIETEVFNELMYQEDKSNHRVVGYGHGVTRTHVFGLEAQLRKNNMGSCGATSSDVMGLKSYIMSIEKKHEEVISELQKRNEELEKQNGQILAQLNCFSSILDIFDQNRETTG